MSSTLRGAPRRDASQTEGVATGDMATGDASHRDTAKPKIAGYRKKEFVEIMRMAMNGLRDSPDDKFCQMLLLCLRGYQDVMNDPPMLRMRNSLAQQLSELGLSPALAELYQSVFPDHAATMISASESLAQVATIYASASASASTCASTSTDDMSNALPPHMLECIESYHREYTTTHVHNTSVLHAATFAPGALVGVLLRGAQTRVVGRVIRSFEGVENRYAAVYHVDVLGGPTVYTSDCVAYSRRTHEIYQEREEIVDEAQ